jgi:hypothetical protein
VHNKNPAFQILEKVMSIIYNEGMKTVVTLAIEHTLLQISKVTLEKVQARMWEEYRCSLSGCYEHPEYLNKILKDLFGTAHIKVVKDVGKYLDEFTYQRPIAEFLDNIRY